MRVAVGCQRPIWQIVLRLAASIVTAVLTTMGPALAQETTTTSVSSVSDLKRAVADQVQHIVVNSHLDLSKESAASGASERWILQLQDVQSIRGNCSETPPGAPLEPPRTSNTQCVISTSANLLRASKNLWIHDLYIEVKITEGDSAAVPDSVTPAATILEVHEGDTWLTSTVFVGERSGSSSRAVNVAGKGRLYARSSWFGFFTAQAYSAMRINGGASAALQTCMFSNNVATGELTIGATSGGPAIGLVSEPFPSAVWLQGCSFMQNVSPADDDVAAETEECEVYSDVQFVPRVWSAEQGITVSPQWLQTQLRRGGATEATWGPPDGRSFLNEDSRTLVDLRQAQSLSSGLQNPTSRPLPSPVMLAPTPSQPLPDLEEDAPVWYERHVTLLAIGGSVIAFMLLFAAWLFFFRKMCCACCECAFCEDRADDWETPITEPTKSRIKTQREVAQAHFRARFPGFERIRSIGTRTGTHASASAESTTLTPKSQLSRSQLSSVFTRTPQRAAATVSTATPSYVTPASPAMTEAVIVDSTPPEGPIRGSEVTGSPGSMAPFTLGSTGASSTPQQPASNKMPPQEGYHSPELNLSSSQGSPLFSATKVTVQQPNMLTSPEDSRARASNTVASTAAVGEIMEENSSSAPRKSTSFGLPLRKDTKDLKGGSTSKGNSPPDSATRQAEAEHYATHIITPHLPHDAEDSVVLAQHSTRNSCDHNRFTPESAFLAGVDRDDNQSEAAKSPLARSPSDFATPKGHSPKGSSTKGDSPTGTSPSGSSPKGSSPKGTSPKGRSRTIQSIAEGNPLATGGDDEDRPSYSERFRKQKTQGGFVSTVPMRNKSLRKHGSRKGSMSGAMSGMALEQTQSQVSNATSADDREPSATSPVIAHALHASPEDASHEEVMPAHKTQPVGVQRAGNIAKEQRLGQSAPKQQHMRRQQQQQPQQQHQAEVEKPNIEAGEPSNTVIGAELADTSTVPLLLGELIAPTSNLHQKWNKYNASFAEGMQGTNDGSVGDKEESTFQVSDVMDSSINISPPPLRKSSSQKRSPVATDTKGSSFSTTTDQPPSPSPRSKPNQLKAPQNTTKAPKSAKSTGSSSTDRPKVSPMPSPREVNSLGSLDPASGQSVLSDSLMTCNGAPIVPNQPAASPDHTVSLLNNSNGNTSHRDQDHGSNSNNNLLVAGCQGTDAASHALNDVTDTSSDQEIVVERRVVKEAESTALETSEALGAPPLKRHASLGTSPRSTNRENLRKGSKGSKLRASPSPLCGTTSAGPTPFRSSATTVKVVSRSRIPAGHGVNSAVNSAVNKGQKPYNVPKDDLAHSVSGGNTGVPSFPVSAQSAIVSPSGEKVFSAEGCASNTGPATSARATKAATRPPRNKSKSPADVVRNPVSPSFNSSAQSSFPVPSGTPSSSNTTATASATAIPTPTSPVSHETAAPWVRGRHSFDLTKSSAPPTNPAQKYAKNRAHVVSGSNASSVSPPCPASPDMMHGGHAFGSDDPKSGHSGHRRTTSGGRVSRRGSPMSSEAVPPQAALPPPPPARTRSSEAAPAYSDAGTPVSGTPVSGGGRSGPRRTFSSQWSNYNEEEESSSTLPLTAPPPRGPRSNPSQQQSPKGHSQKSAKNGTQKFVQNTPEGAATGSDVEGDSVRAVSPPPQPSYATVWETPPHTASGDLDSSGGASGGGSGGTSAAARGAPVPPRALQHSSSQRWRSKFPQDRGPPGGGPPSASPPGAPQTPEEGAPLAPSAGGSSLMHVMPSAHLDSNVSHPPDSHELYAVSSGAAAAAGETTLIASSSRMEDREAATSAQVATGNTNTSVPPAILMCFGVDASHDMDSAALGSSRNSIASTARTLEKSSSLARERLRAGPTNPALLASYKPDGYSANINSMPPAVLVAQLGTESPTSSPVATRVAGEGVATGGAGASGVATGGTHLPAIAIPVSAGLGTSEEGGSQGKLGRAYSPRHPLSSLGRSQSGLKGTGAGGSGRMVSSPPPPPLVSSPHSALPPPPQRQRFEPIAGATGASTGSANDPGGLARSGSFRGLGGGVPQSPGGMSMASYFSEGAVSVLSDGAAGAQAQVALWIAEAETEGAWFTEKYELLEHQRTGGHGITNFAVNKGEASCGSGGMHDRALKFFADLSAFERIDALRAVPAVQPCMSVILGSFSEGFPDEEAGPLAEPLVPPCIVSMHLETLEERVTRSPPDAATALIQLAGVASALTRLHDAGYVYHNVKPCDIAWCEATASWELIDFGRCMPAGTESAVPLEISTRWTPPEILKARDRKHESFTVDTAADIWAFGIMGYELLTGNTAFPPGLPRGTIRRMLHGKAPLPWEDHANSSELTDELTDNEVKGLVLSCLARSPSIRPPAAALAATLQKLVEASKPPPSAAPTSGGSTNSPPPASGALDADTGGAESQNVPQHSGSGGFLREPLMRSMHEDSSAVATADSAAFEAAQSGEGLRVGPAGLAVSAKPCTGIQYGDISACVTDTLDISQSRDATQLISGELPAELRSDLSVTAAMW